MLLDARFLIELLRSPLWTWTAAHIEGVLRDLGLREEWTAGPQESREFSAGNGLACSLYSDPADQSPSRLEFLFVVPAELAGNETAVQRFLELTAIPVRSVLGPPALEGRWDVQGLPQKGAASGRMHWVLEVATIAVELRHGNGAKSVALVVERNATPQQAAERT